MKIKATELFKTGTYVNAIALNNIIGYFQIKLIQVTLSQMHNLIKMGRYMVAV